MQGDLRGRVMSISFTFSQADLASLRESLRANVDEMLAGATDAAIELANMGVEEAKRRVPVSTGALRESIRFRHLNGDERFKIIAVWGTSMEYSEYVEFGTGLAGRETPVPDKFPGEIYYSADWTRGMAARPYMYPSSQYVASNMEAVLKRCIQRRVLRGGG